MTDTNFVPITYWAVPLLQRPLDARGMEVNINDGPIMAVCLCIFPRPMKFHVALRRARLPPLLQPWSVELHRKSTSRLPA